MYEYPSHRDRLIADEIHSFLGCATLRSVQKRTVPNTFVVETSQILLPVIEAKERTGMTRLKILLALMVTFDATRPPL